MLVRGENLPMKYPWEEPRGPGGQVKNVCPLGAEKGQSLPSSALRVVTFVSSFCVLYMFIMQLVMLI